MLRRYYDQHGDNNKNPEYATGDRNTRENDTGNEWLGMALMPSFAAGLVFGHRLPLPRSRPLPARF